MSHNYVHLLLDCLPFPFISTKFFVYLYAPLLDTFYGNFGLNFKLIKWLNFASKFWRPQKESKLAVKNTRLCLRTLSALEYHHNKPLNDIYFFKIHPNLYRVGILTKYQVFWSAGMIIQPSKSLHHDTWCCDI